MIHVYSLFLIVIVSILLKFHYSHWSRRGVRGPSPVPLFGNLFQYFIGKKHFGEVYQDIYKKYPKATYVGIYKFSTPSILVRDVGLVKSVLVENFNSFRNNDFVIDGKLDPLLSKNMFFAENEEWKKLRTQVGPLFTAAKLKGIIPLIVATGEKLVNYIEGSSELCSPDGFEAKKLMEKYTLESVATCGYGIEAHAFTDDNSPFVKYTKKIFEPTFSNNVRFMLAMFVPFLNRFLSISFLNKEVDIYLRSIVKQIIENRLNGKTKRYDFMQLLLDVQDKWNRNEENTIAHTLTFLTDGYETSSTLLTYTLYQLAINPRVQSEVQREIDEVLKRHDGKITDEALQSLSYMERVFHEALRMHHPTLTFQKLCTKDFKLPPQFADDQKSVIIPAGTPIIIPNHSIQNDPLYFANPTNFEPDRFTESEIMNRPKYSYLGFSEGPRSCVGSKFAFLQAKVAIVSILSKFNVTLSSKTIEPLQISPTSILLNCENGIWILFNKRTVSDI